MQKKDCSGLRRFTPLEIRELTNSLNSQHRSSLWLKHNSHIKAFEVKNVVFMLLVRNKNSCT